VVENIVNIVEKLKKEMKKDKNEMFKISGKGSIDMEVGMEFLKEKYIKMLIKDCQPK
jgi:hypothetical protein